MYVCIYICYIYIYILYIYILYIYIYMQSDPIYEPSRRDSFARFGAVLGGEVKARRGSWGI